jgi:uncharacterized membrane protein YdjX (TVP38/TMEM64 family)
MRVFSSGESRRKAVILLTLVVAITVAAYLLLRRYAPFVFNSDELRLWVDQFGALAPVVFVLIQTAQVIFAPIPGQVVALAAGYLFGPVSGTIYSLTGVLIGSAVAFLLARRYGRSFVESMIHEDAVSRFDSFVDTVGIPGLIAFVVLPGLPDDVVCFLSGLTEWRFRTFMLAIAVGRLPAYVLTVYAGGELASERFFNGVFLIAAVVVVSAVGYYKQEKIRDYVGKMEEYIPF